MVASGPNSSNDNGPAAVIEDDLSLQEKPLCGRADTHHTFVQGCGVQSTVPVFVQLRDKTRTSEGACPPGQDAVPVANEVRRTASISHRTNRNKAERGGDGTVRPDHKGQYVKKTFLCDSANAPPCASHLRTRYQQQLS